MDQLKTLITNLLNRRTAAFLLKHKVQVIAVVGSVGKTSTSNALRAVLSKGFKVQKNETNYNTDKSIHLQIFGEKFATNFLDWIVMVCKLLYKSYTYVPSYEIIVLELGTDAPGDLAKFSWLKPSLSILTSISPEHMANFDTLDDVAKEELSVAAFSKKMLINQNAVDKKYIALSGGSHLYYGKGSENQLVKYDFVGGKAKVQLEFGETKITLDDLLIFGSHSFDAFLAAGTVAKMYGMSDKLLKEGLEAIEPVAGRMQLLAGKNGSIIVDDSYNSSPLAAKAALQAISEVKAAQRVVLLGNMNELGEFSKEYHRQIGLLCDPSKIDLVITLGPDANKYLAEAASENKCQVLTTKSPTEAGNLMLRYAKPGTLFLVKGSQNGVFAEESIKPILKNEKDELKLVRQSEYWMNKKRAQFA